MPKTKPHQRGRATKPGTPSAKSTSDTIYFYLPNVKPYGIFSQWASSRFCIPISSLAFLTAHIPERPPFLDALGSSVAFTCAEQSYMFCKALRFDDTRSCLVILGTSDPKTHKKIGRAVEGFSDYEWDQVKSRVARVGNWYKFTDERNLNMRKILLDTGEKVLAEASRQDRVWGIGYNEEEAETYREMWGENLLGICLADVRDRIRMMEHWYGEKVWDWDGKIEKDESIGTGIHFRGMSDGEEDEEEEARSETKEKDECGISGPAQ